jgi:type IV secretory pathway VirB2 component (pilin)
MNVFGFDLSHYVWCIKCMIWIGVGTRLISLWLILSNSVKQGRSDPCNFVCCCLSRNHKNGSDGTLIGHIIATIAVLAAGIYLMIPSSKFNVWTSDTHSCNLVVAGNASNNCYIENIMKLPGPGILLGTVLLLIVAILGSAHRHNVLSTRCSETCITLFALFIIIFAVFAFTVGLLQLTPGNSTTQCELMDSIVIAVVTVYFLGKTYYFATNQDDRRTHPVDGISGGFEEKSDFNYAALA